jgi:D-glycero-alpha-D-manno-heptose-7-phosphate kinase
MSFFVTRTPFRISFFGGGTDYPEWYLREGGAVLSTTINKYCYLTCRYQPLFFQSVYRVVWAHIETVSNIREILHPAVREALLMMGFEGDRALEIHHHGDLPARTGMGSSSAFANGLLLALSAIRGAPFDKETLFNRSIHLEQERLKENVGSQDQVATAMGGLNTIRFNPDGTIIVDPIQLEPDRERVFEDHLMLFYTGSSRIASHVAKDVISGLSARAVQTREMYRLVWEALRILSGTGDIEDFGRLLDETWKLKRGMAAGVSNSTIDEIYETGRRHGALGGKLLGAGGSGFMLFFCPPEKQSELRIAMDRLLHVPIRLEKKGCVLINTQDPQPEDSFDYPVTSLRADAGTTALQ